MDELRRLFAAAPTLHPSIDRMTRGERFLWLALETAQRKRAILDLTWDRVDFETRVIHFAVPGKKVTKKRRPSVPISDALLVQLKRMHDEKINDFVMDHGGEGWSAIQAIVVKAGLAPKQKRGTGERIKSTGISPHTLRHTAATHMARRGVPLYDIAGILGNTLAMVEKVYAKHCPGRLRAAVNSISSGVLEPAE
jgi:integrase